MLLDKLKTKEERLWYTKKAIENNWSSIVLDHQIATKLIERLTGNTKKVSNYLETVESPHNERVLDMLKAPIFDWTCWFYKRSQSKIFINYGYCSKSFP